jgi:predicted alpha/beta hydrolase family esterase
MEVTVVFVPGLRDRMPDHWQERLAAQIPGSRIVAPLTENKLSCAARVEALERTLEGIAGPIVLVAHSAGTMIVAHWAAKHQRNVVGALLATPVDLETPLPAGSPTMDQLREQGWLPIPRQPFPFRTIVAASDNDPVGPKERVRALAQAWGSRFVELGQVGHLVPANGYGDWSDGMAFIRELSQQQGDAS